MDEPGHVSVLLWACGDCNQPKVTHGHLASELNSGPGRQKEKMVGEVGCACRCLLAADLISRPDNMPQKMTPADMGEGWWAESGVGGARGRNPSARGYQGTMPGRKYEHLCVGTSRRPPHVHQKPGVRGAHSRTPQCVTVGAFPFGRVAETRRGHGLIQNHKGHESIGSLAEAHHGGQLCGLLAP